MTRISAVLITQTIRQENLPRITERILACRDVGEIILVRDPQHRVYARWLSAKRAMHHTIYFQDDDCLVDLDALIAQYDGGTPLCTIATTHWSYIQGQTYQARGQGGQITYAQLGMVGWGALFPAHVIGDLMQVVDRHFGVEDLPLLEREADRIMTVLCRKLHLVQREVEHLPGADSPTALCRQPEHYEMRAQAIMRAVAIRQKEG